MEIITKEDYRSFRVAAVFLILTGVWVGTMAILQHNPNSFFLGSTFTILSVVAFAAIVYRKPLLAKMIWSFGTPVLVLLSCFVVPVETTSIIVTYGDALIGGSAFVFFSYSEKENKIAFWSLALFTVALCVYDYIVYANVVVKEDLDFYVKYYSHMKANQMLHYFSIIYLIYIVRKNKFRIQNQLSEQIDRLRMFTEGLIHISKEKALYDGLLENSIHEIAKYTSKVAGVSRVSIWKYDEEKNIIYYVSGYHSTQHEGFSAKELHLSDYPNYMAHLLNHKIIRVDDAQNDDLTNELKYYLEQNKILSMMDCPVFVDGKFLGILCCEEQREYRKWDEVDQLFCQAMTQLVSVAYYSSDKVEFYKEIQLLNKKLEERNKALTEVNGMIKSSSMSAGLNVDHLLSDTESIRIALGEYSYKNSHQVRGPLSRILGLVSLYKRDESINNRRLYMEHIEKSALELDEIVKEMTVLLNVDSRKDA